MTKCTHIVYKTKNDKLRTRICPIATSIAEILTDTRGITHEILQLTLRSGEMFAFDITGAQYGYHEAVTPWTKYSNTRILFEHMESDKPAPKSMGLLQVDDHSLQTMVFLYNKANRTERGPEDEKNLVFASALEMMNYHMVEWQADEKMSLKDMWKLPEKTRRVKLNDLLDFIEWSFHSTVQHPWSTVNGRRLAAEHKWPWVHGKK